MQSNGKAIYLPGGPGGPVPAGEGLGDGAGAGPGAGAGAPPGGPGGPLVVRKLKRIKLFSIF